MQMRKYIGAAVSVLLIGTILLVFADPRGSIRKDSRRILLGDPGSVDEILLYDAYDTTRLFRQGDNWLIRGGEKANPVAVDNLLYAAEKIRVGSVLTDPLQWKGGTTRQVHFLHGGRELLHYEVMPRENMFLVRANRSGRVFSVSLPGYAELDLDRVFSSHTNHYREHMLIDLLPSEIRSIEVDRKGEEAFRFTMDDRGEILCRLPRTDSIIPADRLDDLSIRLLFSYFTAIRFEDRVPETSAGEETGRTDPGRWLATLTVESRRGERHTMRVYSMPAGDGRGADMFMALVMHNDDPGALLVKFIYLDVLMRGLAAYFAPGG
jgi:hypothetical protein